MTRANTRFVRAVVRQRAPGDGAVTEHELAKIALSGRPDFEAIAGWVPSGTRPCSTWAAATGSLLKYLTHTRSVRGYGIEIADETSSPA